MTSLVRYGLDLGLVSKFGRGYLLAKRGKSVQKSDVDLNVLFGRDLLSGKS